MPSICICSRKDAEALSFENLDGNKSGCVSIRSSNEDASDVLADHIVRLQFDDIDEPVSGLILMSDDDARLIVRFVEENRFDVLIVHCTAGRSRSAATAAAIHDATGWEIVNARNSDVFADPKFSPNMHVYKTLRRAFRLEASEADYEKLWQQVVDKPFPEYD